jgi:hypothetical protein
MEISGLSDLQEDAQARLVPLFKKCRGRLAVTAPGMSVGLNLLKLELQL